MKCINSIFALALLAGAFVSTAVGDELDDALSKVATWTSNDELAPLQKIEEAVVDALNGKLDRGSLEQKLITALQASSTRRSRSFLCRQLRIVGTDADGQVERRAGATGFGSGRGGGGEDEAQQGGGADHGVLQCGMGATPASPALSWEYGAAPALRSKGDLN